LGDVEGVRLRLVQGNVPQHLKFQPEPGNAILGEYVALSKRPAEPPVTHLIWPRPRFLVMCTTRADSAAGGGGAGRWRAHHRRHPGDAEASSHGRIWNGLVVLDETGDKSRPTTRCIWCR